jgi:hypothetical protein
VECQFFIADHVGFVGLIGFVGFVGFVGFFGFFEFVGFFGFRWLRTYSAGLCRCYWPQTYTDIILLL